MALKFGRNRRRERGVASIVVLGALVALIALVSLGIDVGLVLSARNQLHNATDAAALAAAMHMIDTETDTVTLAQSRQAAVDQAKEHWAVANSEITVDPGDVRYGSWDLVARALDEGVDTSVADNVTGVSVRARLAGGNNNPVPAVMARVLGRDSFNVGAESTAYLGFAGRLGPGEVDLPIAIDCCKIAGSECNDDFCDTVAEPPNPCELEAPEDEGASTVTCLEFFATGNQNACWTEFDPTDPSVNTPGLIDIVEGGNTQTISTATPVYLDNGTKTPVVAEIRDRFLGVGDYEGHGGVDRYAPIHDPGIPDSWVVGLPVVECQSDDHCAGGGPARIVGVVCFEVREILVTPEKVIKGRFLCPTDPLFDECDVGFTGTGGGNFGVRADQPVLVR